MICTRLRHQALRRSLRRPRRRPPGRRRLQRPQSLHPDLTAGQCAKDYGYNTGRAIVDMPAGDHQTAAEVPLSRGARRRAARRRATLVADHDPFTGGGSARKSLEHASTFERSRSAEHGPRHRPSHGRPERLLPTVSTCACSSPRAPGRVSSRQEEGRQGSEAPGIRSEDQDPDHSRASHPADGSPRHHSTAVRRVYLDTPADAASALGRVHSHSSRPRQPRSSVPPRASTRVSARPGATGTALER